MPPGTNSTLPQALQQSLLFAVLLALGLVLVGRLLVPGISLISTTGAVAILLGYGALSSFYPTRLHRRQPVILRFATVFGLGAGAVFAGEIILEYLLLPADNSVYGKVEFGLVFLTYFAAGFASAFRTRSVKNAALTSIAAAVVASLLWLIVLLAIFYVFRGSERQTLVLRAEGDYEDFARSRVGDFNVFIMEDFMGATFFHLLLGPVVAGMLGMLGGLLGKLAAALRK